jgi:hypothetical protein
MADGSMQFTVARACFDRTIFTYRLVFAAWKFVKLMEVSVSPDPDNAHVSGSVALVKDG